ncbi:MAG: L-seryl-tRNA(Sec) selenium transferase [Bacillota bacterium]|nr:L-seryl-tRNA(Sec) selenium transferase [Clostridia bacterium]
MTENNQFKWLPAVDEVLEYGEIKDYSTIPRTLVVEAIRDVLCTYRKEIRQKKTKYHSAAELRRAIIHDIKCLIIKQSKPMLRSVINATGVVLHTNLGRAVLSEKARQAVNEITKGYSNLEFKLDTGTRGSRYSHVEELLLKLTGAESCLVVNNNAAAVLLALDTLAKGKESIVSRGELVEIGGAFRVPEVMERSGSKLVEVGTTNKTYIWDFERVISSDTGILMKVHTSNYRVVGFTHEASVPELVELGQRYDIPVMVDLGSGCIFDLKSVGVGDEPLVQQVVAGGADVVTFSGDKLLGGPQAGIIVGREKYLSQMKKNPLTRALRIDKMTIAALEATLRSYLDPAEACHEIPTLEMLTKSWEVIKGQSEKIYEMLVLEAKDYFQIKIEQGVSPVGGGSLPMVELPTSLIMIKPEKISAEKFISALRGGDPPVIAYIREDWVVMDPRTILEEQYPALKEAIKRVCGGI